MDIRDIEAGAIQYRAAKIEDIDPGKHEMFVRAAPYSEEFTDIGANIEERFLPGTFARAVKAPHRLNVFFDHGGPLVGRGTEAEDRPDGIYVRAKIGRTGPAEEMLSLLADEILTDVSVEFRGLPDHMKVERYGDGLRVTHRRAHLTGFAAVPEGAYGEQALVLSARDAKREREQEAARAWLEAFKRADPFTR
jgi:phage head maturation protease